MPQLENIHRPQDPGLSVVILDFAPALELIEKNADALLDNAGNERETVLSLFNQLITDFVYINDAEDWPKDFETYYRSLFNPYSQSILDQLFELIEEMVVTHLPNFREVGIEVRNQIESFAFVDENSTTAHIYMPHKVFRALTQQSPRPSDDPPSS